MQGIFSLALDNDLVERSPVRKKHKPALQRQEKLIWKSDVVKDIIEKAPPRYRALFCTAALTGVRLGELLALQWKHIDLQTKTMQIEQSLWHGQLQPPKTASSVRRIFIGPALEQALTQHHGSASRQGAEDFVFCRPDGTPLHPDLLRKDVLYPVLDRLNIPRCPKVSGFHTFRHSAASFINAQTGNLKLAQKLLGHSNVQTTASIYTHTTEEEERQAALAVERAIYGGIVRPDVRRGEQNRNAVVN